MYLGIVCTWNNNMSSTVRVFNRKTNNLLTDFHLLIAIHYLFYLIATVCLYMSQLFKLYDKNSVNCIYVA